MMENVQLRRDISKLVMIPLLVVAIYLVFGQTLRHEFVNFDDEVYVTMNPTVQTGLSREGILWALTSTYSGHWHPLTWVSHMLDCQLYGLNAGGHHLTNFLFHIINTLLLFVVFRRMTGEFWKSLIVAALFALHPLHVESVAWVAERKDVLSAFFCLLAMWAYVRYVEKRDLKGYLMVLFLFALGLMAKAMLVTLPFVLLLLDYWPLRRFHLAPQSAESDSRTRERMHLSHQRNLAFRLILEKTPFLVLSALSSSLAYVAAQGAGAVGSFLAYPLTIRIANSLVSYATYIVKTIWPHDLAVFYPHPGMPSLWQVAAASLLLVSISFVVMVAARRCPYLVVGWLWYLGMLVPVVGVVQAGMQAMADRYTYLPLIGLFVMVCWGVPHILARWGPRRIVLAVSTGLLLPALGISGWLQVRHWRNNFTLYEHTLSVTGGNYLAHNNLGVALANQGRIDEAIAHFTEALRIKPNYEKAHFSLGWVLAKRGESREAMAHFTEALRIEPQYLQARHGLGNVLFDQGRIDEAIAHYEEVLRIEPEFAEVHYSLGAVLFDQGRVEEAIGHYEEALRIRPDFFQAHYNLGVVLDGRGRIDEAIAHYNETLRIKPGHLGAHMNLGLILASQGKIDGAIAHYVEVLRLKPDFVAAYINLGAALAKQDKAEEAVALYREALRIKPDFQEAHYFLGLAYLRIGDRSAAVGEYEILKENNPELATRLFAKIYQ